MNWLAVPARQGEGLIVPLLPGCKRWLLVSFLALAAVAGGLYLYGRALWMPLYARMAGRQTLEEAVSKYGPEAEKRLKVAFHKANAPFPPESIILIGLKEERKLELWAKSDTEPVLIR